MADPVAVAEATLAGIAACDDPAIFTAVTRDRAMTEARAAAVRLRAGQPRGPLDGVPVAWKDLFDLQGMTTTAGSAVLADAPPATRDAQAVANLAKVGMVCVGRVNMTEFAYIPVSASIRITARHATRTGRTSRACRAAHRPARRWRWRAVSCPSPSAPTRADRCACRRRSTVSSAIRPARGVIRWTACFRCRRLWIRSACSAAPSRKRRWSARRCGAIPFPPPPRSPSGARIFVPINLVLDGCEPAVLANFEAAIERLARAGAIVERGELPAFDALRGMGDKRGFILAAEAYAIHQSRLDSDAAARMDRRVVSRLRTGSRIALTDYLAVAFARRKLIAETDAHLAGWFVAFPTSPIVAPPLAPLEQDEALFFATNAKILRNTSLGNFLDWCGVSLPTGTDADGMPTAVLLSATHGRDEALLAFASGCETIVAGP
jgi:aspartyl-tRNA(Asn)/glutamyl-tRNA(Gln) amidotransferase subunit A